MAIATEDLCDDEDILASVPLEEPPTPEFCCYLHKWLCDYADNGPWCPRGQWVAVCPEEREGPPACPSATPRPQPVTVYTVTDSSLKSERGDSDGDRTASYASESLYTSQSEISFYVPHK